MTATNDIKMSVSKFKSLHTDDQLGILALIYREISGSIPADSLEKSSEVSELVEDIQEMSDDTQINALRDLLPANKTDQDEVMLDPNPSKALTQLVQGEVEVPTGEYGKLNPQAKLAFWYQIAQKLGSGVASIPSDYSPSGEGMQLFNSIKGMGNEQMIEFVTQVFSKTKITEPPQNSEQ